MERGIGGMKKQGRYGSSGMVEDQYEPESRRRVLKNLLGIRSKRQMDELEAKTQALALEYFIHHFDEDHKFTEEDVCLIHREWLGEIYSWAGQYRQVNLSKPGITFAASFAVPYEMRRFEEGPLATYTPCNFTSREQVVEALAIVHVEFILIHPFRDGNGRTGRMLASLMAMQAGLPGLDFSSIRGKKRDEYFSAVKAGFDVNYEPMKKVFNVVISKAWNLHS
jgi:cell filamentation protein